MLSRDLDLWIERLHSSHGPVVRWALRTLVTTAQVLPGWSQGGVCPALPSPGESGDQWQGAGEDGAHLLLPAAEEAGSGGGGAGGVRQAGLTPVLLHPGTGGLCQATAV